jgi:hypothetical protein
MRQRQREMIGRWAILLGMVALVVAATGCFSPVSPEQQSDWRWKKWNPNHPMDPEPR